ncbi:MAG: phytoene synthase [Phenylobacterium zucineum]|nr:MAG: phytoene synthase [Phenylobacterium zucineum]
MTDALDLDDLLKRVDPDRWLSSRFIGDTQARADVAAIYAFDHELGRAPKVASNPLMGEIRLAWWREVLDEVYEARPVRQHPTAKALATAITRRNLPREPLEAMIDARLRELDSKPMTLAEALRWALDTGGSAALVAAQILDSKSNPEAARSGGQAWAIGRLMATAGLEGEGAQSALVRAQSMSRGLSSDAFPAIVHAALSRPRAKGRTPGDLGIRVRLLWAVLTGVI